MIRNSRSWRPLQGRLGLLIADVDWRDALEKMGRLVLLPFHFVAVLWRFGGAAGRFIFSGAIELCVVMLGLLFFAMLAFGLIRALLHPLFR